MIYLTFQNNNKKYNLVFLIISFICLSSCGLFNQNNSGARSKVFDPFQFIENVPCDKDSDCALVNEGCCGCNAGESGVRPICWTGV